MEDAVRTRTSRAETSTVVAVVPGAALDDVHGALDILVRTAGIRPVVVTLGDHPEPRRSDRNGTTVIEGLVPRYLNNAVASLRLSSLPAVAWWREPSTDGLAELADLVDRLVLDVEDPIGVWTLVPELSGRTAVSDLRWTRLTRWRDLFAQFFDLPDVRQASAAFTRLDISGGDPHAVRLLAGWITSRLPGGERLDVSIEADGTPAAVRSIRLSDKASALSLRLSPDDTCIETEVTVPGISPCSRVVSAGDQRIAALLGEELRVRSRDIAFEDAVAAAGGIR
jgi:glucose-6-phosphate dehydrogenase assembly protein OpcA